MGQFRTLHRCYPSIHTDDAIVATAQCVARNIAIIADPHLNVDRSVVWRMKCHSGQEEGTSCQLFLAWEKNTTYHSRTDQRSVGRNAQRRNPAGWRSTRAPLRPCCCNRLLRYSPLHQDRYYGCSRWLRWRVLSFLVAKMTWLVCPAPHPPLEIENISQNLSMRKKVADNSKIIRAKLLHGIRWKKTVFRMELCV